MPNGSCDGMIGMVKNEVGFFDTTMIIVMNIYRFVTPGGGYWSWPVFYNPCSLCGCRFYSTLL